jgi:hypothetical protein
MEDLIDGESEESENQLEARLDGAAHAQESAAELILEAGIDTLGHGAVMTGMWQSAQLCLAICAAS